MQPAHAKVNLWLNVVGRRSDGYHLLESLVAFVDLCDRLEARPADGLSLKLDGPFAEALAGEADNLVLRAARQLADRAGVAPRATIHLDKHVPVAAGLGGGSADAAAALRQLAELWRLAMPEDELFELAATLGADVPMCLSGRTAFASGIGEQLQAAPALPDCAILLANPGAALATRDVFTRRVAGFSPARPPPAWRDLDGLVAQIAERGNDLADAAISLAPDVARLLAILRASDSVRAAAMSGSGATCFALYATTAAAQRAAALLPAAWWRHVGRFVSR